MKISLTQLEIEALHAAAGNVDPVMFEEMNSRQSDKGDKLFFAWQTGRAKLKKLLEGDSK